MKTCRRCDKPKPLDEFNRRTESPDGRTPTCKACIADRRKQDRLEGPSQSLPDLSPEQRKYVYTGAILRMRQMGLTSEFTTSKLLARVEGM